MRERMLATSARALSASLRAVSASLRAASARASSSCRSSSAATRPVTSSRMPRKFRSPSVPASGTARTSTKPTSPFGWTKRWIGVVYPALASTVDPQRETICSRSSGCSALIHPRPWASAAERPDDPLAGGVDVQALAARAGQEDPERRRLAGRAEAPLAGGQRLIDPAALDGAGHPLRHHLQAGPDPSPRRGCPGRRRIPRRRPGGRPPGRGPAPARDLRRARPAARSARPGTGGCSAAATSRPASGWPGTTAGADRASCARTSGRRRASRSSGACHSWVSSIVPAASSRR